MNVIFLASRNFALAVDRIAQDIEQTSQRWWTDWYGDGCAGVLHFEAAPQAVGRAHGHRANDVVAEVLLDFEDQRARRGLDALQRRAIACRIAVTRGDDRAQVDRQGEIDLGQLLGRKLDVHDRTDDLCDSARTRW